MINENVQIVAAKFYGTKTVKRLTGKVIRIDNRTGIHTVKLLSGCEVDCFIYEIKTIDFKIKLEETSHEITLLGYLNDKEIVTIIINKTNKNNIVGISQTTLDIDELPVITNCIQTVMLEARYLIRG